jgi:hypothetical protein
MTSPLILREQILVDAQSSQRHASRAEDIANVGGRLVAAMYDGAPSAHELGELETLFEVIAECCAIAVNRAEAIEVASRNIPGDAA